MHHCLRISEVLNLIFEFVRCSDDELLLKPQLNKKTLALLARTCRSFSSPALDILWCDLSSFSPLLSVFPVDGLDVDNVRWSTFHKYAKRVKAIHAREEHLPVLLNQKIVSLQHRPESYAPLLPNITELEWSERSLAPREDSSILLLRYFAAPSITTITLYLVRWLAYTFEELAVLADLPRLCPNVASFSISFKLSWDYEPIPEIGRMVTQWPKLRTLRACAIGQSAMDWLFTQQSLETLNLDYHDSSPMYVGRIPDMVHDLSLSVERPALCTRLLESAYASPTRLCLLIGMNEGKEDADVEDMFRRLPSRFDPSRLLSLTIHPRSSIDGIPMWNSLELLGSHVSSLVEFMVLRELDLDLLCTAQVSDADYARMAASLTGLESLKLGTANPSIQRTRPAASVRAVIALLTHCKRLATLHVVFDGTIPPPVGLASLEAVSRMSAGQGWGITNRRITKLCVGSSPIVDATINPMASCFQSVMPCLSHIEPKVHNENWRAVQNRLEPC